MNSSTDCLQVTTERQFDQALAANGKMLALIYATWCPFCLMFLATFKKYAEGRNDWLLAQDNQEILADRYGVNVIPTVLCFENGQISQRLDGTLGVGLNERQLVEFMEHCGFTG
jgi:thioredoxin-like negative regulator of GroEL